VTAPPSERENWIAVLRAVAVLIQRGAGVEETALLPMLKPGRGQRFRFSVEGDRADLIRVMEELEAKVGRPPGPRIPRPVQLTDEQRLQRRYREAGETH
jgi:hypothetical protein